MANKFSHTIVSDRVKDVVTVLLPQESATTRMERRSTPTRLLPRPLRLRGLCMGWGEGVILVGSTWLWWLYGRNKAKLPTYRTFHFMVFERDIGALYSLWNYQSKKLRHCIYDFFFTNMIHSQPLISLKADVFTLKDMRTRSPIPLINFDGW